MDSRFKIWLLACFALLLIPFLYLSFCSFPAADDFSYAINTTQRGFWGAQKYYWNEINSRFFATLFLTTSPVIFKRFDLYHLLAPASLMLLIGSTYIFLNSLTHFLKLKIDKGLCFIFTLIFIMCFINENYSLAQFFYWYPGIVNYLFPTCLTLVLLSYVLRSTKKNLPVLEILMIFFIGGLSETFSFVLGVLWFLILCYNYFEDKTISRYFLILFLGNISCFLFLYFFSSGIGVRLGRFPERSLKRTLTKPFESSFKNIFRSIKPSFFSLWIFVVFYYGGLQFKFKRLSNRFSAGFFFILCISAYIPVAYGTGRGGPGRLHAVIYFFVLIGLLLLTTKNNKLSKFVKSLSEKKVNFLIVSMLIIGFIFGNVGRMFFDLSPASSYAREHSLRIETLKNSSPNDIVLIEPIELKPRSIFFADIRSSSPTYAKYWNVLEIKFKQKE